MNNLKVVLLDLLTGEEIHLRKGTMKYECKSLGIDYTAIYRLLDNKCVHIKGRYILRHHLDKCFTMVDIDSNKEYICIQNKSLFLHLNIPSNENDIKYISAVKRGVQKFCTINNIVFSLKETRVGKTTKFGSLKGSSSKIINIKLLNKKFSRIGQYISSRIRSAMKSQSLKKDIRTYKLIGCDMDFLRSYLESKFTKGMSWDNYGQWHIDHIKPCNSFNLSVPEEVKSCFHYTNLQPLWATTNIASKFGEFNYVGNINKGDKIHQ